MNERIRAVRKHFSMTLEKFGERIGVTAAAVSNFELDKRQPSNQIIYVICREFGVNEIWLRTGEGEMFEPKTEDDEIAEFLGSLVEGREEWSRIKKSVILGLKELPTDFWPVFLKLCKDIAAEDSGHPPEE